MSEVIELQTGDEQNRTFRVTAETPGAAVDLLLSRGIQIQAFSDIHATPGPIAGVFILECIR